MQGAQWVVRAGMERLAADIVPMQDAVPYLLRRSGEPDCSRSSRSTVPHRPKSTSIAHS